MTHEAFIKALAWYNVNIKVTGVKGTSELFLTLNGEKLNNKDYTTFGYVCGGAYQPCGRTEKQDFTESDVALALAESVRILSHHLLKANHAIGFHDIERYMQNRKKNIKADTSAFKRVFRIIRDEWQTVNTEKVKFLLTEANKYTD